MNSFPQMSTSIDTKPPGLEWMTAEDVKDFAGNHILCRINFLGKVEDNPDRCRLFYHLLGSPYLDKDQNKRLQYIQTSVEYDRDVIVALVKRWGLTGKSLSDMLTDYELFCQFCVVDGKIATKSLTMVDRQKSA